MKRWTGRAAAGTETAALNPMVEATGADDEDGPWVLYDDVRKLQKHFFEALQSDLENGVRWINQAAAENFKQSYPELSKTLEEFFKETQE